MPTPTRNILILAHPGHELRIHHWLELHRPTVYLLTDGSGGKLSSRTHYSRAVIENAGGLPGAVFGTITDKAWYSAILGGQSALFTTMLNAILDDIPLDRPVEIISDALDGYNPMHDMAWAFGKMVQHRLVASAISARHLCSAATTNVTGKTEVVLQLDSAARSRKIAAVEKYTPLAEEAQRILACDPTAFDQETLLSQDFDWQNDYSPHWEAVGQSRVQSGLYSECITYDGHIRPIWKRMFSETCTRSSLTMG
ncbi:hypothetical protein [Brucella haematophila]|uniref:hypothetical protein n=1 Tax=Brucella haematophila TaxID=419474 RepID=UPI00110E3D49|nr:hypothetical protein [Brucella haematophila]TMV03163.1 hypothetical protein FGI60_12175 [Brucella haematophila]